MGRRYYKNKEEKNKAFYQCILGLWNRHKAGKELNPSVMIDRFHLGHVKIEPYIRLATQENVPTFKECVAACDELRAYQRYMNRKSREKKKTKEQGFAKQTEISFDGDRLQVLHDYLDKFDDGVHMAAHYLLSKGWKVNKPEINYIEYKSIY